MNTGYQSAVIDRVMAEDVLRDVIAACDPAARVREALDEPAVAARLAGRRRFGIAIGKAALAMARGAGEVVAGVAVVPRGGAGAQARSATATVAGGAAASAPGWALPVGWRVMEATHPEPDDASIAAGLAVHGLVTGVPAAHVVLALLSGGASALAELPRVALGELVATVRAVMAAGAPIDEINAVRGALSALKAGQLALASPAPVVTLAVSDVIGDRLAVIGSGPTVGPWLDAPGVAVDDGAAGLRQRARAILERYRLDVPPLLVGAVPARSVTRADHAAVIAPMVSAAHAAVAALAARGVTARLVAAPLAGDVAAVARALATGGVGAPLAGNGARADRAARGSASAGGASADGAAAPVIVAWGEPTLEVPSGHGAGGRAQQLALLLARELRGSGRSALVVGTDGVDGPPPADRPAPAGAWVDGTTWDAIAAAGLDPAAALARCDAGTALAAVGALVVTGATGINHADLVMIG